MRRASGWWLAPAVMAVGLAASLAAARAPEAGAKVVTEDETVVSVVDSFGMDLIGQTEATTSSAAVIHLRVADELWTGDLRARLHAPPTTRAELLEAANGQVPTPLIAEWTVEDALVVSTDDHGVIVSVPIQPPGEDSPSRVFDGPRPLPLHLEVIDATGSVLRGLPTFLIPGADAATGGSGRALTVALIVDLRMPPSHLADGGAVVDAVSLDRMLGFAEVLTERSAVPLTVAISTETLDALALVGDDNSMEVLRTALRDRQLLATTWTSLNLLDWARAVRADVILDGLSRSVEALRWIGLEAGTVMHLEHPLTIRAVRAVTEPETGVDAFVAEADPSDYSPVPPVTLMADTSGGSHLLALTDPTLAAMVLHPDTELGVRWMQAELLRMASEGTPGAVVVAVSGHDPPRPDWGASLASPFGVSAIEPAALTLLLDTITDHPALRLATVDDVLAQEPPVGTFSVGEAGGVSGTGDFGLYLARRTQVEQRLKAYESFLGDDPFLVAPLRTLLAVSASEKLTTGERAEFLNAVEERVAQQTTGVEFLGRGPITVTERSAELPVTLVNHRPEAVTVALELASDTIDFIQGARSVLTLEPGRNDLSIPVEVAASGRASVQVTVTTPDDASPVTLTEGVFSVRFADGEGLGILILVLAAAVLAAWWLKTLRRRSRGAGLDGATVAAPGSVRDNAETRSETGTSSTGDHTRT